jgi:histone H3/H4
MLLLREKDASIKYYSIREVKRGETGLSNEIKVAPMHKLIKRAGATRVSEESALAMGKALEEIGLKVAKEAIDYARHAGRKTVKARDIEIAAQKVLGR